MACTSGGMFQAGISFSSMRQPPLLKQIKSILSEYPDGGQILKELIQNAEDAEASEVKILYDGRRINNKTSDTDPTYNKFFKGPALCVYNNAVFTETDWEGIQMIYSSNKEHNPLKVGRFGLGFKSVFHITDYPCLISSDRLLMIDPQQPTERVNAMIKLCEIGSLEREGINADAFWNAFENTFGFTRQNGQNGTFSGTLFWFPLREEKSALSETLYDEAKVKDLFDGFQQEASSILLFLKSLEKISTSIRKDDQFITPYSMVEIEDSYESVRKKRAEFMETLESVASDYDRDDIQTDMPITIKVTSSKDFKRYEWHVVNYFVCKSASREFMALIKNTSLGYSPYVGVAVLLNTTNQFQGHVFCFLPLPREESRLTGLPVHVNGFFALSQNRHHLKWETDDQEGKKIDDKAILWNKCLIREALPKAYAKLIEVLIDVTAKNGNSHESVGNVYSCFPLSMKTKTCWTMLEDGLYDKLKTMHFLFSEGSNCWISLKNASFATFKELPEKYKYVHATVVRCLNQIGKCHIRVTVDQFSTIQRYASQINDLSPQLLATYLHENEAYRNMAWLDKFNILAYLLSDGRDFGKIEGLELLPLVSGEWTSFRRNGKPIFLCDESVIKILPGQEQRLLRKQSDVPQPLADNLSHICSMGIFQVKDVKTADLVDLLEDTLNSHFGSSDNCKLTLSTPLTAEWLYDVWQLILNLQKGDVDKFINVRILPALKEGTWNKPQCITLLRLSGVIILKSSSGYELSEEVCRCLETLHVHVLQSLPDWIPPDRVKSYLYRPTHKGIIALFSRIGSSGDIKQTVSTFNSSCDRSCKQELVSLFVKCQYEFTTETRKVIQVLQIFRTVTYIKEDGLDGSISDCPRFIFGTECFPEDVALPFPCLRINGEHENLIKTLGARRVFLEELVIEVLKGFQKSKYQNIEGIQRFMDYLVKNFHLFRNNPAIVEYASNIPFLKTSETSPTHRASQLFDPSDAKIQDLLYEESLVPGTGQTVSKDVINTLKSFGLRSLDDIDADVLLQVAIKLDMWVKRKGKNSAYTRKAAAFMEQLTSKSDLLDNKCHNGQFLRTCLTSMSCILVHSTKAAQYPNCLKWYEQESELCSPTEAKEVSMCLLIGATMPTVVCNSDRVNVLFNWKQPPSIEKVVKQLQTIRECYTVQNRTELVQSIKTIVEYMSKNQEESRQYKKVFIENKLLWTGENFMSSDRVIIKSCTDDIDLCPYFYRLPLEYYEYESLFSMLGCPLEQDWTVLQNALLLIKSIHSKLRQKKIVDRDRRMVCAILEKIAIYIQEQSVAAEESEQLIMIDDDKCKNALNLRFVSECTYDDDPACFSELDDNVFLVHRMIPYDTAETLGVKSITQKAILNAEELGMEEWGQEEPLTTRIHMLLRDSYTDGLSVPKELIQNADDAGASTVKFLYDERLHIESRERVLSKGMRDFQGPAFWAYNNATFSAEDLQNITKLNAGTKQTNQKKIGKFGLGFCSVYNLTDLPSFVTGSNIVFFDPHEKHLASTIRNKRRGLKYNLPNRTLVSRHIDQFRPYEGVFGCNIVDANYTGYNGTLFRLPLRTEQQAQESKILKKSYTHEEALQLLQMIVKTAGNMLLFTQNVKSIELYHIAEKAVSATEPTLIFNIQKECVRLEHGVLNPVCESVLSRLSDTLQENSKLQELHICNYEHKMSENCQDILGIMDKIQKHSKSSWLVSWATGDGASHKMYKSLSSKGALPLSAVAVPCADNKKMISCPLKDVVDCFYDKGHVFCFLPLPLVTGLPIHINGCFSVTTDRRQLLSITEDDKDSANKNWNDCLMEDALVNAHVNLLERLTTTNNDSHYTFYDLWPTSCADVALPFKKSFYRRIILTDARVFGGLSSWYSFKEILFLDPKIRQGALGDLIFQVSSYFTVREGKAIIDMPGFVLDNMKQFNKDRIDCLQSATVKENEFCLVFLQNLTDEYWCERISDRNKLIRFALCLSDERINSEMQRFSCIPTAPSNVLRKPSDMVDPKSKIAFLFIENDGRFPVKDADFRSDFVLNMLVKIGMMHEVLPQGILLDRCSSIQKLAKDCCGCAFDRCKNLIKYLCNEGILNKLRDENEILDKIADINMFPVLPKPNTWAFSWKGNEKMLDSFETQPCCKIHRCALSNTIFVKSKQLFRQNTRDLVGIVEYIADESVLVNNAIETDILLSYLKMKGKENMKMETLVSQMMALSQEYTDKINQFAELKRIHFLLLQNFENFLKTETAPGKRSDMMILKKLSTVSIVLVNEDLVKTSKVAFKLKNEYHPLLYRVPALDQSYFYNTYKFIGVNEKFTIEDILSAFDYMKQTWGENPEANIENSNALLKNLQCCFEESNKTYDSVPDIHERIYAPDTKCVLWPTKELVIENEKYEADTPLKILHQGIIPLVAQHMGVKAKEMKCFEDISMGIPFGQHERLETRIKGLLRAYPCDSSIMNELLQNADDAGATEINFVKDYRSLATNRLFHKSCEPFQGPSLCLYNNSYFTDKDIEGIHNLGQGSKHEDPTKTGQYGVGFNAVYHLTDTPSFITRGPGIPDNGILIFLDPLCKHVPRANQTNPGQMCSFDGVRKNFYDHLTGFSYDILLQGDRGTVFRFPLRKLPSDISSETVDITKLDDLLRSFQKDMFDAILFLKNIDTIKISNVTTGRLVEEYTVRVKLNDDARKKRLHFTQKVREYVKKNREHKEQNLEISPFQTVYEVEVHDSENRSSRWAIVQRFGFSGNISDLEYIKVRMKDGDIGQMPFGGLAIPLTEGKNDDCESVHGTKVNNHFSGRAFCFLPLPLRTGFPLHVNGHFALDHEARRNIGDEGYKQKWNYCLANHVIIPAWHSGLLYLQDNIQKQIVRAKDWREIQQIFKHYHRMFPVHDKTFGKFWNDLMCNFYQTAMQEENKLFPCVVDKGVDLPPPSEHLNEPETRFKIFWTFVSNQSSLRLTSGVFNDIQNHLSLSFKRYSGMTLSHLIEALLKSFEIKLLHTPSEIRKTLKEVNFDVPVSTPDLVISYLKKHSYPKEKCVIGQINTAISETRYRSSLYLREFVQFLNRDKHFYSRLEGLPILLTSDLVLRACSTGSPVYISEFSELLPQSSSSFMHKDIRSVFDNKQAFESKCFQPLQMSDFVSLLEYSVDPSMYAVGNEVSLATTSSTDSRSLSEDWLCLFYDFLLTNSLMDSFETKSQRPPFNVDNCKFRRNLSLLSKWAFLPCLRKDTVGVSERILIPISDVTHVVHLSETILGEETGKSFKKLKLPELDVSTFKKCKQVASTVMKDVVAAPDRPNEMLECLEYHRQNIPINALAPEDAINILAFFSRNLETLRRTANDSVSKLKKLPLFLTQQESLTPVDSKLEVIILPEEIPFQGLQDWADTCNITLLKKNDSIQYLYDFLGLKTSNIDTVYAEKILPAFRCIPIQHRLFHIQFLRRRLTHKRFFTVYEQSIISRLIHLPFISVKGTLKRANEFYSRRNPVFACMLDTECFPPEDLQTDEWFEFLKLLGLKCNVDDVMLLKFAGEIERDGIFRMTKNVREQSAKLIKCFLIKNGRDWQPQTLSKLKSIRFIVPYVVPEEMKIIFNQVENADRLVCFENSVSHNHEILCWTSMPLIDDHLCQKLDWTVRKKLGIFDEPTIDCVVRHCQNVCDSFKSLLQKKNSGVDKEFIKRQMKRLYEYFKDVNEIDDKMKSKLACKPIIYLPEDSEIVTVHDVAIELPTNGQIKPYLYTAPINYGEFFEVFIKLGCREMVDFCHYARVLEIIKKQSDGKEMTPPERTVVKKAIKQMFIDDCRNAKECERLYLPSRKMILTNAKDLVVSNRIFYEHRLKRKDDIQFFVGFQSFDLNLNDPDAAIRNLPNHIRPRLLTEAVTETVCWDVEIENSIKARQIESFLHSEHLANGLCRILKKQVHVNREVLRDADIQEIKTRLKKVTVKQVFNLKTALHFDDILVADSEKYLSYFIKPLDEMPFSKQIFYFQDTNHDNQISYKVNLGLTKLINLCAKRLNTESVLCISPILQKIENPETIPRVLDELDIPQYNFTQTEVIEHFPKPGTAVDARFFPFLEQGIFPFEEFEYDCVAMDLDDTVLNAETDDIKDPVYIYVQIIREVQKPNVTNLARVFVVNTGNPDISTENVPIYRLFRFVRKLEEPGNAMQRYGDEPLYALPFDETCVRIRDELTEAWTLLEEDRKRVMRRLYLKWYPDRNLDNKDYCAKIFNYIKIVISRLENKEIPDRNINSDISRGLSNSSSTSFYFANVHRRATAFVQAYNKNIDEYNRSKGRGRFCHTSLARAKRRDIDEAKRWLRQAKSDFVAAKTFLSVADGVDAFNWICYTCHQACEKALKSAYYAKDADNVPRGSDGHNLSYLASDEEMRKQARLLEGRLGDHTKLRYPDALSRPKTPSDLFRLEDAEFSISIAEQIVHLVEEYIS